MDFLSNILKLASGSSKQNTLSTNNHSLQHGYANLQLSNGDYTIPQQVLDLLWFTDGPFRNYVPNFEGTTIKIGNISIDLSFCTTTEPSAISINLPIRVPTSCNEVARLNYYPSYSGLSPEQRWMYIQWLRDVNVEIDIGYVFILYYGLERHLFFGKSENAFKLILQLRSQHHNKSFLGYSGAALTLSALLHNRPDWFLAYLQSLPQDPLTDISNVHILAKAVLKLSLTPSEVVAAGRAVGFSNQRYIKDETQLFMATLETVLREQYGQPNMPLAEYPVNAWPWSKELVSANYSLPEQQRSVNIPSILQNQVFARKVYSLLMSTHEAVKRQLREARNSKSTVPIQLPKIQKTKKPTAKAFLGSKIFQAIDLRQFDSNVECYNNGVCPYCGNLLPRRPTGQMKCPKCAIAIYTKPSPFTTEKALFRSEDLERLSAVIKERVRRNSIWELMEMEGITEDSISIACLQDGCSVESALAKLIKQCVQSHARNGDMGLSRNSMLCLGRLAERVEDYGSALKLYLRVCYYDLNGPKNSSGINRQHRFNPEFAMLSPGVIKFIEDIMKNHHITLQQLGTIFLEEATKAHMDDMPLCPQDAWVALKDELAQETSSEA